MPLSFPSSVCRSIEQSRRLQNGFEIEYAFQRFAIEKSIAEFTLFGLCPPTVVRDWGFELFNNDVAALVSEVTTFQERLDERIGSLSGNHDLMRYHWEVIEQTRDFRIGEFLEPALGYQVIEETVNLMNSLMTGMREQASSILGERLQRRCDIINGCPPRARKARLHIVV
ncbi:hypothetical protein EPK99_23350 [Neorhizobium lilium]|uniref:Uncharacterized protein n=1 Tax=Neorhizobium lilium TaxID=2503024 RepID=A0A3S4UIV0_9HYPH|nr:hypothetical protein [Neorhizobium lilium]RWX74834.1 hypothetical protein EPK99_23350 [Neorhizobium lilium]